VLNDTPDEVRSGVYHDGKVYETDGETAIGIHEPADISMLPPIGVPPSIRLFERFDLPHGEPGLTYHYLNPTGLYGPNSEVATPEFTQSLDFDVHIVGAVADSAATVDADEAAELVLGYAVQIVFVAADLVEMEQSHNLPPGPSRDFGTVLGPFLTTPEDLTEFTEGSNPANFVWNYTIRVNDVEIQKGSTVADFPFTAMLQFSSRIRPLLPAEILAWPKLEKPALEDSDLGRCLLAGDKVEVAVDGFGTLVARLS
ncbi:MAG: fumarylacetoacetate hydrolase family protein, partial [Armatimonadetes bacterium]|nr:fumarylacetoacetate hydrolase family protein [Armatimonadota bacterium]